MADLGAPAVVEEEAAAVDFMDSKKRKLEAVLNDGNGRQLLLTKDDLKKLLEAVTKEQLIDLIADLGSEDATVTEKIREFASKDPATRKLFVRGLAWETTTEALRDAFAVYGEVDECAVIVDKSTKKSKGYGFVRYKDTGSALLALQEPSKMINGRMSICNLAAAGAHTQTESDVTERKLFVSSLSYDTTSETLLREFAKYGEVEEGAVAYDKNTGKSRGFAFVTYRTVEGARGALVDRQKMIDGRTVQCKLASEGPKEKPLSQAQTPYASQMQQQMPNQFGMATYNPGLTFAPQGQGVQSSTGSYLSLAQPPNTPYPGSLTAQSPLYSVGLQGSVSPYGGLPGLSGLGGTSSFGSVGGTGSAIGVLGSGGASQSYLPQYGADGRTSGFSQPQAPGAGSQGGVMPSYYTYTGR